MFEHCSLCFRVRMMAALKRKHLQEHVVRDDDSDTMVGLVGKRVIPILVKNDGAPMLESMSMVHYIEGLGSPVLTGPQRPEIAAWADAVVAKTAPLTMPRYPLLGLPEFSTPAALAHYTARKFKTYGDFAKLRSHTLEQIGALVPMLDETRRADRKPAGGQRRAVARRYPRAAAVARGCRRQRAHVPAPRARLFRKHDGPHRLQAIAGG